MFGYVRPPLEILPQEEADRFRRAYCGLCHTLGERYGPAARMILNYDFTYLAILLSDPEEAAPCRRRCVSSPVRLRAYQPATAALELAADESVILAYWQLRDGVEDHGLWKGLGYRVSAAALRGGYRKAAAARPGFDGRVREQLAALSRLEGECCPSMDQAADTFAQLLAAAADGVEDPVRRREFRHLLRRKSLYEPVLSLGALQWRRLLVLLLRDHKRGSRDHMIKSMTGYGRARQELHKRDITVEVRSVNNRYLDCTVKMPRMYAFAEDAVKKHVQQAVSRGKVDVFITVDATAADVVKVAVNRELAAQYAAALGELSDVCGTADYRPAPETLARFPDVLTVTKADEDLETVSADLCAVLDEALAAYNDMRAVEGQKLAEDISNRLDAIERYTGQVEMRSPETVAEYRAKLTARMEEVLQSTTVDEQRILMEAAIYADKVAVDEETVRLRSHVAQLRTMLASDEPMGRKMDFLIQEVNRESNTIGSKCNDVAIANVVVGLKAEVEKMREQVQNVE